MDIRKITYNTFYFLLATTFFVSAASKMIVSGDFASYLFNSGLPYFIALLTPVLIILEMFIAVMLLFRAYVKPVLKVSFVFVLLVSFVYTYLYFFKDVEKCMCFGKLSILDLSPFWLLIRNISLILIIIFLIRKNIFAENIPDKLSKTIIVIALIIASFVTGNSFYLPKQKYKSSKIEIPLNKHQVSKYYNFSPDSSYLLMIMSYNCPHCLNSIANAGLYKNTIVDEIIYIGSGSDYDLNKLLKINKLNGTLINLPSDKILQLSRQFPTFWFVKNNKIVYQLKGELPSPAVLKLPENFLMKK